MTDWFVNTDYFVWLILLPFSVVMTWYVFRKSQKSLKAWFGENALHNNFGKIKLTLRLVGILLLFVSLMGPYWGKSSETINRKSREIYFLLDVSGSMNAEDLKPSRLDKTKLEIRRILPELKGDKVGLILFSDFPYAACPLTDDLRSFQMYLDLVNTEQFVNQGTNIRAGLSEALNRFAVEDSGKKGPKPSRCIVLISDGEDFGETYTSVTKRLRNAGVALIPVGIGSEAGAPVPIIEDGKKNGYKTDQDGNPAHSKLNPGPLEEMASEFDTKLVRLSKQSDNFDGVVEQIQLQTASLTSGKGSLATANRYQIFLFISILCFGVSFFLLPVRNK